MKKIFLCLLVSPVLGLLLQCAWAAPLEPTMRWSGATYRPGLSKSLRKNMDAIPDSTGVVVFDTGLPAGLQIQEGKLSPVQADSDQFEILGTVTAEYNKGELGELIDIYWAWGDYRETWRKVLCWPQAPLKCVTFGIWNVMPSSWPCWKAAPGSAEDRKADLVEYMMRGAKAMGGNVLVLARQKDIKQTVYSGIGNTYGQASGNQYYGTTNVFGTATTSTWEMAGLTAFVVKKRF